MPWLAAGLGIAISAYVFYPGYLTWDSAYQWWQVRHQTVDPAHPPIMVWIWSVTNRWVAGPGGYFLLQLLLYWLSVALFASALRLGAAGRAVLVLALGFWPPLWGLSLHLWKDVGTMAFFCLAAACFARDIVQPHVAWRAAGLAAIIVACMYRHNALSAAVPFLVYGIWRHFGQQRLTARSRKRRTVLFGALACLLIQLIVMLPNQILKLHAEPLWPLLALWDIAAVSVEEDRLLIPAEWREPGLTLDVVREDFNPGYSGLLFDSGLIRLNPFMKMGEEDFDVLLRTWLLLPVQHPAAYWKHRLRVTAILLGWRHDPDDPSLVYFFDVKQFRDNPPVAHRENDVRLKFEGALEQFSRGALFQGGSYLLLSLGTLAWAARRRDGLMATLAGSGLLFVLPLLVLAPSGDFRYLGWMIEASLLSVFAAFITPDASSEHRDRVDRTAGATGNA